MCSRQAWRRLGKLRARPCAVDWGCGGSLAPGLERADEQTYSRTGQCDARARADENGTRGCYPSIGSCRRRDHDRGSAWLRVVRGSPEEHRSVALSSALWVGCCGSRSFSGVANPRRNPGHTHKAPALGRSSRHPMLADATQHRVRPAARSAGPPSTQQPTRRLVAATTMHASARAPRTTGHMPRRRGSRPARAFGGATAGTRPTAWRSFRSSQPAPWNRRRGLLRSSTTGRASACGAPRPLT